MAHSPVLATCLPDSMVGAAPWRVACMAGWALAPAAHGNKPAPPASAHALPSHRCRSDAAHPMQPSRAASMATICKGRASAHFPSVGLRAMCMPHGSRSLNFSKSPECTVSENSFCLTTHQVYGQCPQVRASGKAYAHALSDKPKHAAQPCMDGENRAFESVSPSLQTGYRVHL